MKRLNFDQTKAEKVNMRKVDLFFVVALILFCGLITSYMAFDYHLSGITLEQNKNKILEHKISQLNLVIESLQAKNNGTGRSIASIGPNGKTISLDSFYKEQMAAARAQKDATRVLSVAQKIIASSADTDLLAQAYFYKSEISCATYVIKENSCLADVEVLVGQFPESVWAGEALIVLSSVYTKQKRYKEANSLLKIVKNEFSSDKKLMSKADQLQKTML